MTVFFQGYQVAIYNDPRVSSIASLPVALMAWIMIGVHVIMYSVWFIHAYIKSGELSLRVPPLARVDTNTGRSSIPDDEEMEKQFTWRSGITKVLNFL